MKGYMIWTKHGDGHSSTSYEIGELANTDVEGSNMHAEEPNMAIQAWLSRNNTTTQTNPIMIDVADDFFGGKGEGDYHVDENEQAKFLTIAMLFGGINVLCERYGALEDGSEGV